MACLSDLGVEARLYFSTGACDYLPNAILFGTITIGLVRFLQFRYVPQAALYLDSASDGKF